MSSRPRARRALLVATLLFGAHCGGPVFVLPGGALAGEVVAEPVRDWSHLPNGAYALETRPSDPYSVNTNVVVRDGALYIDPAPERRWAAHIRDDPRVRLRVDGRVHPLLAVRVTDARVLEDFDPEREVHRLDPRTP